MLCLPTEACLNLDAKYVLRGFWPLILVDLLLRFLDTVFFCLNEYHGLFCLSCKTGLFYLFSRLARRSFSLISSVNFWDIRFNDSYFCFLLSISVSIFLILAMLLYVWSSSKKEWDLVSYRTNWRFWMNIQKGITYCHMCTLTKLFLFPLHPLKVILRPEETDKVMHSLGHSVKLPIKVCAEIVVLNFIS